MSVAAGEAHLRLNRFLARAGVASRRKSDELIKAGIVRVGGQIVRTPGMAVCPLTDPVHVYGKLVKLPDSYQYILFNKPKGLLVTRSDPAGRTTVFDSVEGLREATVSVGRLDRDTTGVLLLTDDGQLTHRLAHPRFETEKTYEALVTGVPVDSSLRRLRSGVELSDGMTAPAAVRIIDANTPAAGQTRLEIRIHEGRNRQVKRMCEAIGHPVVRLERTTFATLTTKRLGRGRWRTLTEAEISRLCSLVCLETEQRH